MATCDTWIVNQCQYSPPTSIRRRSCAYSARDPFARSRNTFCSERISPLSAEDSVERGPREESDPSIHGSRTSWSRSTEGPWLSGSRDDDDDKDLSRESCLEVLRARTVLLEIRSPVAFTWSLPRERFRDAEEEDEEEEKKEAAEDAC